MYVNVEIDFFVFRSRNHCLNDKCILLKQRMEWIKAVKDISSVDISNIHMKRICSDHFISGSKARHFDVNNPDWVPNKYLTTRKSSDDSEVKVHFDDYELNIDECVDTIPNPIPPKKDEIEFDTSILEQETTYVNKIIAEVNVNFDNLNFQSEKATSVNHLLSIIKVQSQIIQRLRQELLVYKMDMNRIADTHNSRNCWFRQIRFTSFLKCRTCYSSNAKLSPVPAFGLCHS